MASNLLAELRNRFPRACSLDGGDTTRNRLQVVSLVVSLLALLATIILGYLQYSISRSSLALAYMPAIAVASQQDRHWLDVANQGKANIFLCGDRTSFDGGISFGPPAMIAPGVFYYIRTEDLEKEIAKRVGTAGALAISLELYLEDARGDRWRADNELRASLRAGSLAIDVQTISLKRVYWFSIGSTYFVASSMMPALLAAVVTLFIFTYIARKLAGRGKSEIRAPRSADTAP